MSEQIPFSDFKDIGFDASEFAENPEPRVPCVLVLDTSGSMGGMPINELNQGLDKLKDELTADSLSKKRAEIAIVTFGGTVDLIQDFITVEHFNPPTLTVRGATPMGEAISKSIQMVKDRKDVYKANGISYYRPWIFMITDGGPTDAWEDAAAKVKKAEADGSIAFFAIGVEGADFEKLKLISPRPPMKMVATRFRELFVWLSQSMQSVSRSSPGDKVALPAPTWAEI